VLFCNAIYAIIFGIIVLFFFKPQAESLMKMLILYRSKLYYKIIFQIQTSVRHSHFPLWLCWRL